MGLPQRRFFGHGVNRLWVYMDMITLDRYVSRRMPDCDVFVGLSGSALCSGKTVHARGAKYVCDRGSSHIRTQDQLLRDEHALWDLEYAGIDPRVVDREEAEYDEADCITVPSTFALQTFAKQGVPRAKLRRLPYGVDLTKFHSTSTPDAEQFNILFAGAMSLRKGVQYLLQAYGRLKHRRKSLTFAGTASPDFIKIMKRHSLWPNDALVLGHVPQQRLKEVMSRSHVLILPSIEEGFGMVLAQAMACGCPVIGTEHTGAQDLFEDAKEGFIVRIRQPDEITERLQQLADDSKLRCLMSHAAIARVKQLGGWRDYGSQAMATYEALLA